MFLSISFQILLSRGYTGIDSAWMGVHFIDNQYRNVNGDDFLVGVLNVLSNPPEDSCLQLMLSDNTSNANGVNSNPYDSHSFHSCDTSRSMAGICTRSKQGKYKQCMSNVWNCDSNFFSDTCNTISPYQHFL